jgi:hypothetical protein
MGDEPEVDHAPDCEGIACGLDRGAGDLDREECWIVSPEGGRQERGGAEGEGDEEEEEGAGGHASAPSGVIGVLPPR